MSSDPVSSQSPAQPPSQPAAPPAWQPPAQQELAVERTRIAHERTLMAWIRTCMSMVSFGFTINELFGLLGRLSGASAVAAVAPTTVGLGLVALGTFALSAAAYQHVVDVRRLNEPGWRPHRSLALVVAVLMIVGSVSIFITVSVSALRP